MAQRTPNLPVRRLASSSADLPEDAPAACLSNGMASVQRPSSARFTARSASGGCSCARATAQQLSSAATRICVSLGCICVLHLNKTDNGWYWRRGNGLHGGQSSGGLDGLGGCVPRGGAGSTDSAGAEVSHLLLAGRSTASGGLADRRRGGTGHSFRRRSLARHRARSDSVRRKG